MDTLLTISRRSFSFEYDVATHRLPDAYAPFLETFSSDIVALSGTYRVWNEAKIDAHCGSVIWSGPTWRMRRDKSRYFVDLHNIETNVWVPCASFTDDFSEGTLKPLVGRVPVISSSPLNYPVDQVLFINRLPRTGAVLLHASGVLLEDKIYLFCGRSDIGKTTLARLFRSEGARLLNDDRMIIWKEQDCVMASPSPWHGEDPEINLQTAEVVGIFHLGQAAENSLSTIEGVASVSALTATAVLPFYLHDSLAPALAVLDDCAASTASYRFTFRPDKSAVDHLRALDLSSDIPCRG